MYDQILTNYPRLAGESGDSQRIQRAINDCENGILYIPKGEYVIDQPLFIHNRCSLSMHPAAHLVAVKEMDYVLTYDGASDFIALTLFNEDGSVYDNLGIFMSGGDIDGNGLASCVFITNAHHFTMKDISLHNGKKYGLYATSNANCRLYELYATNVYCKCNMKGLSGNVGICSNTCDCHYTDCTVVDYTKGIQDFGGGNRYTRCHVWGGTVAPRGMSMEEWSKVYADRKRGLFDASVYQNENHDYFNETPEMLIDSVAFDIHGAASVLDGCYADTASIGYYFKSSSLLTNSGFFNNQLMGLRESVAIHHESGFLQVIGCSFRAGSKTEVLFKGETKNVDWISTTVDGENLKVPDEFLKKG